MTLTAQHLRSVVPSISKSDVEDAIETVKNNKSTILAIAVPLIVLGALVIAGIIEKEELSKIIKKLT